MKDFPMFTTEFGVASLILKEIPYRSEAYIIIQDTQQPEQLLQECISFCRMCGADRIYARGHEITQGYPLHCAVYEMRAEVRVDDSKVEMLFPVTEETVGQWRQLMNERLRSVDNAATLEKKDEKEIGLRRVLNFGHTVGHAVETSMGLNDLLHGECVSIGMLAFSSDNVRNELISVLNKYNLPTELPLSADGILSALRHDKKANSKGVNAVFVDEIGSFRLEFIDFEKLDKLIKGVY